MSNKHQNPNFHEFQDSTEDISWTTISISEGGDSFALEENDHPPSNDNNKCDASLDDTLPIEDVDEMHEFGKELHLKPPSFFLPFKTVSSCTTQSPLPPKDMREFHPMQCSSSIQLDSVGANQDSSIEFRPKYCSSKVEHQMHIPSFRTTSFPTASMHSQKTPQRTSFGKTPTPVIQQIMKTKPYPSPIGSVRVNSEEFKPQRCSTALSESEFKIRQCLPGIPENSTAFIPLRSSTGLNISSLNPPVPSAAVDFKPIRSSTGLHENSVSFLPLRCSTGLNESAAFNPPMSSTTQQVNDSNITEFKNLRMSSEQVFLKK